MATEHAAGNCASGTDGPAWDVRALECPVKGICLCHLPPFSPPRSKITDGNFIEVTWRESFSKSGQICSHVCFKLL